MLWAIAALLIHFPPVLQNSIAIDTTPAADSGSSVVPTPGRVVPEPTSPAPVLPTSWSFPLSGPIYIAPEKPRYGQSSRRLWLTLTIAQHGAATFDAWSTRRAISSGQCQERNPLLKPFAENASLYAAIQVGPTVLDYLGRRMMKSQQGWARHAWWLPQAVGTAISVGSAAHNLRLTCVL